MKNLFYTVLFALLSGILLTTTVVQSVRLKDASGVNMIVNDTIYVVDTVVNTITESPIVITKTKVDTVLISEVIEKYKDVDTSQILAEFFSVNHFCDTISDSTIIAVIDDYLSANEIIARSFRYTLLSKSSTINNLYEKESKLDGIYIGGNVSYLNNSGLGIGVSAGYLTKKGAFGYVSYDAVNKYTSIGMSVNMSRVFKHSH